MDSNPSGDCRPVTPAPRRARGGSMSGNPFRGEQGRYPAAPYVTYADSRSGSQSATHPDDFDRSCVIYVGGLNSQIEDRLLFDTFRQFGTIVNVVRRPVDFEVKPHGSGQQYAFIRYQSAQDAQNAIRVGEINLDGRKLVIKSRDKQAPNYQRTNSHGNSDLRNKRGERGGADRIIQMLQKNANSPPRVPVEPVPEQQFPEHQVGVSAVNTPFGSPNFYNALPAMPPTPSMPGGSAAGTMPMFMSKVLHVANLPMDMSPKELFTLFSEIGNVEGCYIYPFGDPFGRKFGEVIMGSFYFAQKASEAFNGHNLRGYILEVSYKSDAGIAFGPQMGPNPGPQMGPNMGPTMGPNMGPNMPAGNFPQFQIPANVAPPLYFPLIPPAMPPASPQTWPQQIFGPIPQPGLPPMIPPAFMQAPNGAPMLPLNACSGPAPIPVHLMEFQPVQQFPMGGSPPPPPQSFGWTGPPVPRPYNSGKPFRRQYRTMSMRSYATTEIPGTELRSRCISNSSSTTLVSTGYERAVEGPLIVNGSYGVAFTTPSPTLGAFKEEVAGSDKESTPSPVIASSTQDAVYREELQSDSLHQPAFQVLAPAVIPETTKPSDPANLFIKNLDDEIVSDSEDLKKLFEPFGPVASAHLATYSDSGISRGYGFVAFTKAEDAATAKTKINGTMVGRKRVFVSYAERKEERSQRLKEIFANKGVSSQSDSSENGEDNNLNTKNGAPGNSIEAAKGSEDTAKLNQSDEGKENQLSAVFNDSVTGSSGASTPEGLSPERISKLNLSSNDLDGKSSVNAVVKPQGHELADNQVEKSGEGEELSQPQFEQENSNQGWHATQLAGIAEVEEDESQYQPPREIALDVDSSSHSQLNLCQQQEDSYVDRSANPLFLEYSGRPINFQEHSKASVPTSKEVIPENSTDMAPYYNQCRPGSRPLRYGGQMNQYQHQVSNRSPSPRRGYRGQNYNQRPGDRPYYRQNGMDNRGNYARGGPRGSIQNRPSHGAYSQGYNVPTGPRMPHYGGNPVVQGVDTMGNNGGYLHQPRQKRKWNNRNGRNNRNNQGQQAQQDPTVQQGGEMTTQDVVSQLGYAVAAH
ncbi:hypothetical protein RUND412_006652 [Rhizina undulata]